MFERTRILTPLQIMTLRVAWCVIGIAVGVLASLFRGVWSLASAPAPRLEMRPPVIERRDPVETVARIPVRLGEREVECVLRIDHRLRTWRLTC